MTTVLPTHLTTKTHFQKERTNRRSNSNKLCDMLCHKVHIFWIILLDLERSLHLISYINNRLKEILWRKIWTFWVVIGILHIVTNHTNPGKNQAINSIKSICFTLGNFEGHFSDLGMADLNHWICRPHPNHKSIPVFFSEAQVKLQTSIVGARVLLRGKKAIACYQLEDIVESNLKFRKAGWHRLRRCRRHSLEN